MVFLGFCLLCIGMFFLLPVGGRGQAWTDTGLSIAALLAVASGIWLNRPRRPAAWYLLAAGLASYSVANYIFFTVPPFPSPADFFFFLSYALFLVAFILFIRDRTGGEDRAGLIDALIVTAAVAVPAWVFLMAPYVRLSEISLPARLVSMGYPVVDLLLLAVLVRLLLTPGGRPLSHLFLGLAMMGQLTADTGYGLHALAGTWQYGSPFTAGWMLTFTFLGTAALHPSMRQLSEPAGEAGETATRGRLALLAGAALIPPVVLAIPSIGVADTSVIGGISGVLFLLVLSRVAGLMRDVNEYRRMEKMKDEFVSVVSHELRTPLTSIRGALGLVAGGVLGPLPEKAQRMIDIAASNSDRLVRLINDILDIEKMESGKVMMQKQDCNAADLMRQASEEMTAMGRDAGVTLSVEPLDAPLHADPDRVVQTLTNLISNAIKFSPSGGSVDVSAARRGRDVLFQVRDSGRGIPQDQLENVFGRFQQVDASDSREKGGTGLGLAICRSIVRQHGGEIWIQSEGAGKGSTFFFTLPASTKPIERVTRPASTNGPLLLVCDDDPSVLEVVGELLEQRDYRVITATTAEEAVAKAATNGPAAILLDLLMPGTNGWQAATLLRDREETKDIPIVILSVLSPDEAEPVEADVAGWVVKPLEGDSLFTALERALTPGKQLSTVLIVEDDPDLVHVLTAMFERQALQVLTAKGSDEAIELSEGTPPDLVILDLALSDGDGFAVVEWMRRHDRLRLAPLVVYTASDLNEAQREKLRLGHTEFLTKGRVSAKEFEQRVTKLIGEITQDAPAVWEPVLVSGDV